LPGGSGTPGGPEQCSWRPSVVSDTAFPAAQHVTPAGPRADETRSGAKSTPCRRAGEMSAVGGRGCLSSVRSVGERTRLGDEAEPDGRHDGLGAVSGAELLVDVRDVRLGRGLADEEPA